MYQGEGSSIYTVCTLTQHFVYSMGWWCCAVSRLSPNIAQL